MTPIVSCHVLEGNLYAVSTEDGPGETFNAYVVARTVDGRDLIHAGFVAKGFARDEHRVGYICASRRVAQSYADAVVQRGFINESLWEALPERPSLEEAFDAEFMREVYEERGGRLFG